METKATLTKNRHAVFICPVCKKKYKKNLSSFSNIEQGARLNCRCGCGERFTIIIDRRRHFRKATSLDGGYLHERRQLRGGLTIKNLSKSGAGVEIHTVRKIHEGDILTLKFSLDDDERTFIAKEGVIRKLDGAYVGVEFLSKTWDSDPLAHYLRNRKSA